MWAPRPSDGLKLTRMWRSITVPNLATMISISLAKVELVETVSRQNDIAMRAISDSPCGVIGESLTQISLARLSGRVAAAGDFLGQRKLVPREVLEAEIIRLVLASDIDFSSEALEVDRRAKVLQTPVRARECRFRALAVIMRSALDVQRN